MNPCLALALILHSAGGAAPHSGEDAGIRLTYRSPSKGQRATITTTYTTAPGRDLVSSEPAASTQVESWTDALRLRRVDRLVVLDTDDDGPTRVRWRAEQTATHDADGTDVSALSFRASYDMRIRDGEPEVIQTDQASSDAEVDVFQAILFHRPGTDLFQARILAEEDVPLVVGREYRMVWDALDDPVEIDALDLTVRFVGVGKRDRRGVANFEFDWNHADREKGREVSLRGTLAVDLGTAWHRHSEYRGWIRSDHQHEDGSVSTTAERVHFEFTVDYE